MDYAELTLSNFMESSIGLKGVISVSIHVSGVFICMTYLTKEHKLDQKGYWPINEIFVLTHMQSVLTQSSLHISTVMSESLLLV